MKGLTLDQALKLLELPKVLGSHPKTKKEVKKSIGRYGPYVVHDGDFRSVPADLSFLSLNLKEALKILSKEKKGRNRRSSSKKALKEWTHNKRYNPTCWKATPLISNSKIKITACLKGQKL